MKIKSVRIEYTLRGDVDLEEFTRAVGEFVAGIRAHDASHRYTSYQDTGDPLRFVHIGELAEDAIPALQAEPFFKRFSAFLRERCASGPEFTRLHRVASTR